MTIESDLHRIANALEAIGNYLQRLAYPPLMSTPTPDALDQLLGEHPGMIGTVMPRVTTTPADASQAFISGQWKRRSGDNVQTSPQQWPGSTAAAAALDPWVRVDVPNVEPSKGQLGIKEESDGKATSNTN